MPVPGGTPDYVVAQGEGDPDFTVEIDGGGGGGTPGVDYLTPGESLTQIIADDGGVGYQTTDASNVPVFAFRQLSDPHDRIRIWPAGIVDLPDPSTGVTTGQIDAETGFLRFYSPTGIISLAPELGFFQNSSVAQPAAIADATDAASVIARLNDLLAAMRSLGLIDT
jgi:hypothetical protein